MSESTSSGEEQELLFSALGSTIRLLVGAGADPKKTLDDARDFVLLFEQTLSRFRPDSELTRFNASQGSVFAASQLFADAVAIALEAAKASGGLLDPTLSREISASGYSVSWSDDKQIPLQKALLAAPPRKPASPATSSSVSGFRVRGSNITIPAGVNLDFGGTGKGMLADILAKRFRSYSSWCADIGGDMRVGGTSFLPRSVSVPNPLREEPLQLSLRSGALATSGISRRVWQKDGKPFHHLLDPSTGQPAWTGVVQATALASSAAEAERLAKTAFLLGPEEGALLLEEKGGAMVLDSGKWVLSGHLGRPVPGAESA